MSDYVWKLKYYYLNQPTLKNKSLVSKQILEPQLSGGYVSVLVVLVYLFTGEGFIMYAFA